MGAVTPAVTSTGPATSNRGSARGGLLGRGTASRSAATTLSTPRPTTRNDLGFLQPLNERLLGKTLLGE